MVDEVSPKRMSGVGALGYLGRGETGLRRLVLWIGVVSKQRDGRLLQELSVGAVHVRAHVGGELAHRSAALLRRASPLRDEQVIHEAKPVRSADALLVDQLAQ